MVELHKLTSESHPAIIIENIRTWQRATKTRPIKAKHIQAILIDNAVAAKFLLSTIEADQTLRATSMVAKSEAGDVWQQDPEKLLKKYTVINIDPTGWLICQPKLDNEVDCYIVNLMRNVEGFSVVAQWGERQADGTFLQFGHSGDVICRNQTDKSDIWIVQRKLFDATYEILS